MNSKMQSSITRLRPHKPEVVASFIESTPLHLDLPLCLLPPTLSSMAAFSSECCLLTICQSTTPPFYKLLENLIWPRVISEGEPGSILLLSGGKIIKESQESLGQAGKQSYRQLKDWLLPVRADNIRGDRPWFLDHGFRLSTTQSPMFLCLTCSPQHLFEMMRYITFMYFERCYYDFAVLKVPPFFPLLDKPLNLYPSSIL